MISYTFFKSEELLEAKNYYFDEAQRHVSRDHKTQAIEFLKYFDMYGDVIWEPRKRKVRNEESWVRHNLNRVEGMIERYFVLKEKNRL